VGYIGRIVGGGKNEDDVKDYFVAAYDLVFVCVIRNTESSNVKICVVICI